MYDNGEIIKVIKKVLKEKGISQNELGRMVGMTKSSISRYMNETREFPVNKADLFARELGIKTSELLGIEPKTKPKTVKIPILGQVIAGVPMEAIEDIIDYEEITEEMARKGEHFALEIKGDSMAPRMVEGDIVIVRKQPDANNGDIVIALVNGGNATCKKLKKMENGIMLISNNPDYEPMFYSNQDIESLPVTILGVVIEMRVKFQRY